MENSAAVNDTGQMDIKVENDAATAILDHVDQNRTEVAIIPEQQNEQADLSCMGMAPVIGDDDSAHISENHSTETLLDLKVSSANHRPSMNTVKANVELVCLSLDHTAVADEHDKVSLHNSDKSSHVEAVQLVAPNTTSLQCQNLQDIHNFKQIENCNISMTSTYHPATQNKCASQLLKNAELKKRKLEGTITTTKIIDVALPVAHSSGNYLINTQLGTISHHADDNPSPPKVMKLSHQANVEESCIDDDSDNYCHQLNSFQQSNNLAQSKEESISLVNNLGTLSGTDDIGRLPSLSSFTFPLKYTSQKNILCDTDGTMGSDSTTEVQIPEQVQSSQYTDEHSDKIKTMPAYVGTEIYEAARMSGICDNDDNVHEMLYNATLESSQDVKDSHTEYYLPNDCGRKAFYVPVNDEVLLKAERFNESDVYIHNRFNSKQLMNSRDNHSKDQQQWKVSNSIHGRSGSLSDDNLSENHLGSREVNNMESKENVSIGSGVQVLSTWKVAVNKASHNPATLTPKNFLTNLTNIGKKSSSTVMERTSHTSLGKYLVHSLKKDKTEGQTLNRLQLLSSASSSSEFRNVSPYLSTAALSKQEQFGSLNYHTPCSSSVSLNSSGSDDGPSPPDYLLRNYNCSTPYNTPTEGISSPTQILPTAGQLNAALFRAREATCMSDSEMDIGRQAHNAKERARRARIKLACEHLRDLVPGMTMKTDKATVFEFAVQYIAFLRQYVGIQYDKDFLRNCSPY